MAKIVWHNKAKLLFKNYVENAAVEFGRSTARKWLIEKNDIENSAFG